MSRFSPIVETVEDRLLMATGFVAGYATHAGGAIDTTANIELFPATSTGTITGSAATTTTDSDGYYHFDNVNAGYYVVEELEAGYATSSVSASTTINPATVINGNTAFLVDVVDPSTESITATHLFDPYNDGIVYGSANGSPFEQYIQAGDNANQFVFSLTGNQGNQSTITTLCASLYQAFDAGGAPFTTNPGTSPAIPTGIAGLNPTSAAAIGQIGYLYNHLGSSVIDAGNADGNQTNDGAGLQVAIWSLLYNQATTLAGQQAALVDPTSNFYLTSQTPAAIITAADNYLAASFGKVEDAYFLDVNPALAGANGTPLVNGQSLISTDLLNFTNAPAATPNLTLDGLDALVPRSTTAGSLTTSTTGIPITATTVTLTGTDILGNVISKTATTDSTGHYSFTGLYPSNSAGYTVTETVPAGYIHVGQTSTTAGAVTNVPTGTPSVVSKILLSSASSPSTDNFFETATGDALANGETATIGFWHNKNGQALIDSFNGGPTATNLGNWLAAAFPNLYGGSAGANDLVGQTNAGIAAYFLNLFGQSGQKTGAQILCTALAAYATDPTLAGGTQAAGYGFSVSTVGTGVATYDVGNQLASYGGPTGVVTIYQLLSFVNAQSRNGVIGSANGNLPNLFNTIFSDINQGGDI